MNRRVVPENLARLNRRQTAHHAQQACFSSAIGARHVEPASSVQDAINALKKLPSSPTAAKLGK
jgi:hypothetical protein